MMPISDIDGCSSHHWAEVKEIIFDVVSSIKDPVFSPRLVSDGAAVGVIQKRIVEGAYSSDIVICDVSAKNPNVMFELGLRIAFDKPTVIVKDDQTDYSFDTGIIEHISYPRDLRYPQIVEFKKTLAEKVAKTHEASLSDPSHSPFLKNFGQFKVTALPETEAGPLEVVIERMKELQDDLSFVKARVFTLAGPTQYSSSGVIVTGSNPYTFGVSGSNPYSPGLLGSNPSGVGGFEGQSPGGRVLGSKTNY
jgi:hypothetical protein